MLYIIIDSVLIIKYNPLSSHINRNDIQTIIDSRKHSHNDKSQLSKMKKEKSIIDNLIEYKFKEKATHLYTVVYNKNIKEYGSIESLVLLFKPIKELVFKPQSENASTDNNEFIISHKNEIIVLDKKSYICSKRIKYQLNNVKRIEYSLDGKFILLSIDDNFVYGINDRENKCVFYLEGHKSFVSNLVMRKIELPKIEMNNITTKVNANENNRCSSFKEISFNEYLNNQKKNNSDSTITSSQSKNEQVVINNNKEIESCETQELYEIITVGADGLIGLWKYAFKKNTDFENELQLDKGDQHKSILNSETDKHMNNVLLTICSPIEINLESALTSKQYIRILPHELTLLFSRPLIDLYLINNNSIFTLAIRGKHNNEMFIVFLQNDIDTNNNYN